MSLASWYAFFFPRLLGNIQILKTNVSLWNIHEVSCSSRSPKSLLAGIHQANADCVHLGLNKDILPNKCRTAFPALRLWELKRLRQVPVPESY